MPDYMRKLWQSGVCPFLVPAAFYDDRSRSRILLQAEGLIRVKNYARVCPDGIEGSFCQLLEILASTADSFVQLQRWLADPSFISLYPDELYYDRDRERCLLLFIEEADSRPFPERFCELCGDLGGSGELIASRLSESSGFRVTEERGTAAFLRTWRRQILSCG